LKKLEKKLCWFCSRIALSTMAESGIDHPQQQTHVHADNGSLVSANHEQDFCQDQQQPHHQHHELPEEDDAEEDAKEKTTLLWPEESNLSFLAQTWQRWTYSYMTPLLYKGSKQSLEVGTSLSPADLFGVPTTMEAAILVDKFE
jgi:hypothetical protein